MLDRSLKSRIEYLLARRPAVVLLGARQVGKTTLAKSIASDRDAIYIDLEKLNDRRLLSDDPEGYLAEHAPRLVVIDEVQHYPELFRSLRGLIDVGRQQGLRAGRFLLLGSASRDLLRQSAESLAGRVAYLELTPLLAREVDKDLLDRLWVRGGLPDSFLATSDEESCELRLDFITTYLERDIGQLDVRMPTTTLRNLWIMLFHMQATPLNKNTIASSLGINSNTVSRYLGIMEDLMLVRTIQPWHAKIKKRLVKSPKVYLRDSGIAHALLGLATKDLIISHPLAGASWEGFVIENILASLPPLSAVNFYRSASQGSEIDLLLTAKDRKPWAIEIKRSDTPKLERGFHLACQDVLPEAKFVVYPGTEQFPLRYNVRAIGLRELCELVAEL